MTDLATYWAIVPAAGVGRRLGGDIPKQYLPLLNRTVIEYALQPLLDHELISRVIVCISSGDPYWPTIPVAQHPKIHIAKGGVERCHSVMNGLIAIDSQAQDNDWVLVHDAARPCLRREDLHHLIKRLEDDPVGGLLATPMQDTVKRAGKDQTVEQTLERQNLWRAYTPQMFRYGVLKVALSAVLSSEGIVTDEAGAMERQGYQPRLIEGHGDNIKVTHKEDLALASHFLSSIHMASNEG